MTSSSAFDPYEFFHLAGAWIQDASATEAASRSAISRAYYAAFLTARTTLFGPDDALFRRARKRISKEARKKGIQISSETTHELLIVAVRVKSPSKVLGDRLAQLKDMRVMADYKLLPAAYEMEFQRYGVSTWHGYAHMALQLASQVIPDARRKLPRW